MFMLSLDILMYLTFSLNLIQIDWHLVLLYSALCMSTAISPKSGFTDVAHQNMSYFSNKVLYCHESFYISLVMFLWIKESLYGSQNWFPSGFIDNHLSNWKFLGNKNGHFSLVFARLSKNWPLTIDFRYNNVYISGKVRMSWTLWLFHFFYRMNE